MPKVKAPKIENGQREFGCDFTSEKVVFYPLMTKTLFGKKPHGWEDRGWTGKNSDKTYFCTLCASRMRVGIEDNKPFRWCPVCLSKC